MSLPQIQSATGGQSIDAVFTQMQTLWSAQLNPLLNRPQNLSTILPKVSLAIGDNTISHTLGRALAGWNIVRIRAAATIYDKQDSNTNPAVSLILNSSAAVVIDLEVF